MKVLFVDDDQTVRELLTALCKSLAVEFVVANSGEDALQILSEDQDIVLCITDLIMPEMDGLTLARTLREEYPRLSLFAFTGQGNRFSMREMKEVFDKVYFKPSDYSIMIAESMKFLAIKKYPFLA